MMLSTRTCECLSSLSADFKNAILARKRQMCGAKAMATRENEVLLLQHHLDLGFIYASIAIAIHREKSLAAQCEWHKCGHHRSHPLNQAKKSAKTLNGAKTNRRSTCLP